MNRPDSNTVRGMRKVIDDFLAARRDEKLVKLELGDPKRELITVQHERGVWLADAAKLVLDIQAATHILKATHPSARRDPATKIKINIYRHPKDMLETDLVGSHCLRDNFIFDVAVDNAASLGVFKLLKLEYESKSLIDWIQKEKVSCIYALSDDVQLAAEWVDAFLNFIQTPTRLASHTLAKQLYWLVGDDPCEDAQFHLLAPLYASSLAHSVYTTIQDHLFGEETKVARDAKRNNRCSEHILHEYPDLVEQKLGGTKPQNISQLNSERKGVNYLLSSCPPVWRSQGMKPPYGTTSIFNRFERNPEVKALVRDLRTFLESNPDPNQATRNRRDALLSCVLGEVRSLAEEYRVLPPGWSANRRCRLAEVEQCWLDPQRATLDADFGETWQRMAWVDEIKRRFANWLNAELGEKLPLGDIEHEYWSDLFDDEVWRSQVKSDQRAIEKEAEHV